MTGSQSQTTHVPGAILWLVGLPAIRRLGLAQRPAELVRFLKFAVVGVIGMCVDLTILNVLHKYVGLSLLASNTVSFSAAVLSNFTWNRLWTFPESRARGILQQLGQFALVNVVGLGINNLVLLGVFALIKGVIVDPYNYNLAKITAIGIVLFWNYFANRLWTYKNIA